MLETKVDTIDKKLDKVIADHEERIRCLENKPGRRWDKVTVIIITAVLITSISLIITKIIK